MAQATVLRNIAAGWNTQHFDNLTSLHPQIVHGTLPHRTFEQLRDLIVRGRIEPGSRVVEADVALRFGVSRTPVREAMARLMQEGYLIPVSASRRTEVVVAPLTAESVRELWGMIGALESFAVEIAASLPTARRHRLSDDLERLNAELASASRARPRNHDRLFELQTAFHTRFVLDSAGPYLKRGYDRIRPQVQRYEWAYGTRLDAEYEPSTKEHLRIIAAIRAGDALAARDAVVTHWSRAAVRTIATIESIASGPAPRRRPRRIK